MTGQAGAVELTEIEVTPEMVAAGSKLLADRLEMTDDWLARDLARELFLAMVPKYFRVEFAGNAGKL